MIDLSLRRVASGVVTVLAVVVLAAFVVQAVPGIVGADASYVVLSGSMEPSISPGDAVIVDDVDPADIESGDVITFTRGEDATPVTHRVVEVVEREDGLAFRTKGDANDDPDPDPVPAENVTGEVWFVIPYIGHVVMFANTTSGLAVLVGLPVAAFLVSELYAYATRGERDDATPATTAAETDASDGEPSEATDDAIAVTPTDLKFSSVAFGALATYSGYVAYRDPSALHVAVFAAAVMVVAFVAAVIVLGSGESGAPAEESADTGAERTGSESPAIERPPSPDQTMESGQSLAFTFGTTEDTVADGGPDSEDGPGGGDGGT